MSAPPPPSAQKLSPLHLRLFALLIDYLLIVVVLNLGEQALIGADWDLRPVAEGPWASLWPRLAWGAAFFLGKDALFGVGPGKWFTGIAVRRADEPERPPARAALVLRNAALVLLPAEALLVFVDPFCRRIGDRIAGTVVVEPPESVPLWRRMLVLSSLVLAALLAGLLVAPWNMHRSAAFREAVRIVAEDPLVRRRAGADARMDRSPRFDLTLAPREGRATIGFTTTGGAGTVQGELQMRLEGEPRRWVRESLTLDTATLTPSDAPRPEPVPNR